MELRADESPRLPCEWTVHLIRANPGRAWAAALTAAAAAAAGYLFLGPLPALAAAALILSSTAEYLLPVRCRLTAEGAATAYGLARFEIAWHDVRRVLENPEAGTIRLSPLPRASRLDAFRGVALRLPIADQKLSADIRQMAIDAVRTARDKRAMPVTEESGA